MPPRFAGAPNESGKKKKIYKTGTIRIFVQKCSGAAKLNMVIWVSLHFFFFRPPSRPLRASSSLRRDPRVFTDHLQWECIKRAYQRFFFFNLCDTVRMSYRIYFKYYCGRRLADGPPNNPISAGFFSSSSAAPESPVEKSALGRTLLPVDFERNLYTRPNRVRSLFCRTRVPGINEGNKLL